MCDGVIIVESSDDVGWQHIPDQAIVMGEASGNSSFGVRGRSDVQLGQLALLAKDDAVYSPSLGRYGRIEALEPGD